MYKNFEEVMAYSSGNLTVYEEIKANFSNLIPFIGAGMTATAYGTWKTALKKLAGFIDSDEKRRQVEDAINTDVFEAAELLEKIRRPANLEKDFVSVFSIEHFHKNKAKLKKEGLYLLPLLFNDRLVITTNFDEALEEVYMEKGIDFGSARLHPDHLSLLNQHLRFDRKAIYKLHGSLVNDMVEYKKVVFTKSQYEKAYADGSQLTKELQSVFRRRPLLYLGCSLEGDETIKLLQRIVEHSEDDELYSYAIVSCEPDKRDERSAALANKYIRAILYDPRDGGHNAVRLVLEKLLEDTNNQQFQDLKRRSVNRNPFMYNSGSTNFHGREAELSTLRRFMDADTDTDSRFLWCGMVGHGGSGKSRIAWELGKEYENKDWYVQYLQRKDYDNLGEITARHTENTLLIADYVQQYIETLGKWMDNTAQSVRTSKIRLLLIERDDGFLSLLYNVADSRRLNESRFQSELIRLDNYYVNDDEEIKQNLLNIITDFAEWLNENDAEAKSLTEDDPLMIIETLAKVDPGLMRPLYAMFLTDAVVHGERPETWSRERVLDYVVKNESERIKKSINLIHGASPQLTNWLYPAALRLWRIATVLGGVEVDRLAQLCPALWSRLEKTAERHEFESAGDLLGQLQLLEGDTISAMRPDLIGEYFVLKGLIEGDVKGNMEIYNAILAEQDKAGGFLRMAVGDHHVYVNENPANWSRLLPDELTGAVYPLAAANLIGRLYEWCPDHAQGMRIMGIMEKCAVGEHSETPETATAYNNIGYAYHGMGDYKKALEWFTKAKNIDEQVLGENHPHTAASYNNIGGVYSSTGNHSKALGWYARAKNIVEQVLGKNHPHTADSCNNIGGVYHSMGKNDKALEWFTRAKDIYEQVLGENHPDTANSYNNIGGVYSSMGDYDKALEWFMRAKDICEQVLGENHPDTAISYNNIGCAYSCMGDYGKALEWYTRAKDIREQVLGENHPDTATSYNNIGGVYDSKGDYDKALEWYTRAKDIYEQVLGENHPDTAISYNNIGYAYSGMGDYGKALEWYTRAKDIREQVLGENHLDTAISYNNIGNTYFNLRDYKSALQWSEKALNICLVVLGENHPTTQTITENVAAVRLFASLEEGGIYPDEFFKSLQ